VNVAVVRDLAHVVNREKAKIGVFISLAEPSEPMKTEAVKAGFSETEYGKYPKVQILTIKDLFDGRRPSIPLVDSSAFKRHRPNPRSRKSCFCRGRPVSGVPTFSVPG
jgi:hypothetical protein